MKFRKPKTLSKTQAAPAVRVDGSGKTWGIRVSDKIWIASQAAGTVSSCPNRWWRMWQWLLLGWKWEQR